MLRAPLCPSSGAHDDSVGYHIGRLVLGLSAGRSVRTEGCYGLRSGHSSILTYDLKTPTLQQLFKFHTRKRARKVVLHSYVFIGF